MKIASKRNAIKIAFVLIMLLCCISVPLHMNAQTNAARQVTIKGKVVDDKDLPMANASVQEKGNEKNGVVTAEDGTFSINVRSNAVLVVSHTGYATREIAAQGGMIIKIERKDMDLEQVVVVGYGTQKKISVIGAISTVSTKELTQTPVANITNALAGRLPGLISLQNAGGDPGREVANLLIRGKGTYNDASPLVLVDGVERDFTTIDPNEVDNISLLKDASATAVYGIRGANGVILVTTKRGTSGKARISFTTNLSTQQPTMMPKYLNSYDYARLKNEGYYNEGYTPGDGSGKYFYDSLTLENYKNHADPYLYPDVDWVDEFVKKNAFKQDYNLTVTGGSNLVKYFVSGSFLSQDGLFKHCESQDFDASIRYNRYNFRSNLDFDFSPSSRLSVNIATRNGMRKGPRTDYTSDGTYRVFSILYRLPPLCMPVSNPDGTFSVPASGSGRMDADAGGIGGMNPLAELSYAGLKQEYTSTLEGSLVYTQKLDKLLKGLSWTTNFSYTSEYGHRVERYRAVIGGGPINNFYNRYKVMGKNPDGTYNYSMVTTATDQPVISYAGSTSNNTKRWYAETKFSYTGRTGKHSYTALALVNASRNTNATWINHGTNPWPQSYFGLAGRATYDYDTRYLAEVNLGYNGSENFEKGNRMGFLPAFSVGWVASNEKFMQNVKAIDLLKLRATYGKVGNDKYGDPPVRFMFFDNPYTTSTNYSFGLNNGTTYTGYAEGKTGNHNITWEVAEKYNLGLETRFLNKLIGVSFDWFYEKRKNIISTYNTIPSTLGATSYPVANLGIMENRGYEIELTHNYTIGKVDYWVKANFSYAHNKILYRDEAVQPYPWMQRTGQSADQQFGLVTDGFFKDQAEVDAWYVAGYSTEYSAKTKSGKLVPGDFKYKDLNDDKVINLYDMKPVGYPTYPEYNYAFSFGLNYKSFDLSAMFQGTFRASMYLANEGILPFFNAGKVMDLHLGRWTPETASTATFPRMASSPTSADYDYTKSDFWVKDASYLRFKQFQLGYTLPGSLLERIKLTNARVYVSGVNLITWSKIKHIDPENRATNAFFFPPNRVISLGINISL